jgi:Secretion system C-terminal sorting domain/alpha/beta hydrolase fold
MNKRFIQTFLLSGVVSVGLLQAQHGQTSYARLESCNNTYGSAPVKERYVSDIFTNIKTSTVEYGAAIGFSGTIQKLSLKIYEPSEPTDDVTKRPVIILAHGGSFVGGAKEQLDPLCIAYTRKGYVCASIDYRLIPFTGAAPTEKQLAIAPFFASQDLKAAVRFFRKSAAGTNPYKIDPNFIAVGGISAGSIAALIATYLDEKDAITPELQGLLASIGGIEGVSGNAGYCSKVKAVLNLSGALPTPTWIGIWDVPLASFHGTADATVPVDCGLIGTTPACGSRALSRWATRQGTRNWFVPVKDGGHDELYINPKYAGILQGFVYGSAIFLKSVFCPFGYAPEKNAALAEATSPMRVYPNPSTDQMTVEMEANVANTPYRMTILDAMGRQLRTFQSQNESQMVLNKNDFGLGLFFLQVRFENDVLPSITRKIVFE